MFGVGLLTTRLLRLETGILKQPFVGHSYVYILYLTLSSQFKLKLNIKIELVFKMLCGIFTLAVINRHKNGLRIAKEDYYPIRIFSINRKLLPT
jgi:hypothetical protein